MPTYGAVVWSPKSYFWTFTDDLFLGEDFCHRDAYEDVRNSFIPFYIDQYFMFAFSNNK